MFRRIRIWIKSLLVSGDEGLVMDLIEETNRFGVIWIAVKSKIDLLEFEAYIPFRNPRFRFKLTWREKDQIYLFVENNIVSTLLIKGEILNELRRAVENQKFLPRNTKITADKERELAEELDRLFSRHR